MGSDRSDKEMIFPLFIIIPIILVFLGLLFFSYPISADVKVLLSIPLFLGLALLAVGFYLKKMEIAKKFKIFGWIFFAFYWSTLPNTLYYGEDGDIVNASICIIGVFILFYLAYHEWLSLIRKEYIKCLNWAAGAAAIAGLIYFIIEQTPLAPLLIQTVAFQSGWLLNLFTGNVEVVGVNVKYNSINVVNIIFACTALQSMVLFIGMIIPLSKVGIKRRFFGVFITVIPIYLLNLIRNALIIYLMGEKITSFSIAHNVIGKGGSLIALVILLLIVVKIVPELFDEIINLSDLYKRNGPLEANIKKIWRNA